MTEQIIPVGLCQCGCGGETGVYKQTTTKKGEVQGEHKRFIGRHHLRGGSNANGWKGGRKISMDGYVLIFMPDHYRANNQGYIYEHTLSIEEKLGRRLGDKEVCHHIDGNKTNNNPDNLVACRDSADHSRIHREMKSLAACGNANFRKCSICKTYDDPKGMTKQGPYAYVHRACNAEIRRISRARIREAAHENKVQ